MRIVKRSISLSVMLSLSEHFCLLSGLLLTSSGSAQQFANVEYLCCDWGPAMELSSKTNNPPQFRNTAEKVYFLKQVSLFTKGPLVKQGHGISIYLCKMDPDGGEKTESRELWHNVTYPIDTVTQSTWMSTNKKTKKIALSVLFAGSDLTGLWTIKLDGSELKRIITPSHIDGHLQAINCPSWTADGQSIVFAESLRGAGRGKIAKCDQTGSNVVYLTNGPGDCEPCLSPDDTTIAYGHVGDAITGGLYLMNFDGSNPHRLPNPDDKRTSHHSGIFPAWYPDGKRILLNGKIIDVNSGKVLGSGMPKRDGKTHSYGWAQWGKAGLVGFTVAGILFTDSELQTSKLLGESRTVECTSGVTSCTW